MLLLCDIYKDKYRVLDTDDMILEVMPREDFINALFSGIRFDNVSTELLLDNLESKITFRPYERKMSKLSAKTHDLVTGTGLLLVNTFMYTNKGMDYAIKYVASGACGYSLHFYIKGMYYHIEYVPQKHKLFINNVAFEIVADIRYFGYMSSNSCIVLAVSSVSVIRFYSDKVELTYNHSSYGYILSCGDEDEYKMSISEFEQRMIPLRG